MPMKENHEHLGNDGRPHDSHSGRILFIIWLTVGVSALFLCLRIYCKKACGRSLWWDDHLLVGSWVCLLVYSSAYTHAVLNFDLGRHTYDTSKQDDISVLLISRIAHPFIITAIIWSKTGFAVTLLRVMTSWMKALVWTFIVTLNVTMGLSAMIEYISCSPVQYSWDKSVPGGKCWDQHVILMYHLFCGAYSGFGDIALALLPWKLVWSLHMELKEKIGVGIAMSMGIFAGVTSLIRTIQLPAMLAGDMVDRLPIVYWSSTEVATCIVAASLPVLRVLVRNHTRSTRTMYGQCRGMGGRVKTVAHGVASGNHTVVISTSRNGVQSDAESGKSIINSGQPCKVLMTNELSVTYQDRKRDDNSIKGYEMDSV